MVAAALQDAEGPGEPVVGWGSCNISHPSLGALAVPPLTPLDARLWYPLPLPLPRLHDPGEQPEVHSYLTPGTVASFGLTLVFVCVCVCSTQQTCYSQVFHIPKQQPVLRNGSCTVSGNLTRGRFWVVRKFLHAWGLGIGCTSFAR